MLTERGYNVVPIDPATEFFTTAVRHLHEAGQRAGVEQLIVMSIIGTDRTAGGYGLAQQAHEQAALDGPIPARTQLVAARKVAETLADMVAQPDLGRNRYLEVAGPQVEYLPEMAMLLAERRGHPAKVEGVRNDADPDADLYESGGLLPGPGAVLGGPTFAEWLDATA